MNRLKLMLVLLSAAVCGQARATTLITDVATTPLDLEDLGAGAAKEVAIYVGGTGAHGFMYYTETGFKRFVIDNGLEAISKHTEAKTYIFTLTKSVDSDNNATYTIKEHLNNQYLPGFAAGSGGFSSVASNNTNITFTATSITHSEDETTSPVNLDGGNIYTLTYSGSGGLTITNGTYTYNNTSYKTLTVADTNVSEFQFFEVTGSTDVDFSANQEFPRTTWTVTPCSECTGTAEKTDGVASLMFDDNVYTYWHNNWTSTTCTASGHNHYFVIDLAEEIRFNQFSYTARTNSTNGIFGDYEIYASNEAISIGSDDDLSTYRSENTPVFADKMIVGTGETYTGYSATEITARYLLVVPVESSFATCAEFRLFGTTLTEAQQEAIPTAVANYKTRLQQTITPLSKILPNSTKVDAFNAYDPTTATAIDAARTQIDALASECYAQLNNQIYYISNCRRNTTKILTALEDGTKTNTKASTSAEAKWQLKQVTTGEKYFYIYNPTLKKYISTTVAQITSEQSSAQQFWFDTNDTYTAQNSVAIRLKDSSYGLNVNTDSWHSALTTWSYTDGGSAWSLSFVSAPASDFADGAADGKCYRLRSNRGMYNRTDGAAMMRVSGVTSTDIDNDLATLVSDESDAGTIWKLEKDGDGRGYKLLNLITEYAEGHYGLTIPTSSTKQTGVGATPTTYYLVPLADYNVVTEKYPNGITLNNRDNTTQGTTCIDVNGSAQPMGNTWSPRSNDGTDNQGTVFYFEEVSSDELTSRIASYIASLPTQATLSSTDQETMTKLNSLHANVSILYPEAFTPDIPTATYGSEIKESVAAYRAMVAEEVNEVAFADAVSKFYSQANGQAVQFVQGETYWLGIDDTNNIITSETSASQNAGTIWRLIENNRTDAGLPYLVQNVNTGKYLGYQTFNSQSTYPVTDSEESAHEFGFLIDSNCGTAQVRLSNGVAEGDNNNKNCIYLADKNTAKIWGNGVTQTILKVNIVPKVTYPAESGNTLTFSGLTINTNKADLHAVLTPQSAGATEANAVAKRRTLSKNEDGSYTVDDYLSDTESGVVLTIPENSGIEAGDYTLTVPAGYLVNGTTLSDQFSAPFSVSESGTLTEIEEVSDAGTATPTVYFDMTGRRITAPVKGNIYIANGKKIRL